MCAATRARMPVSIIARAQQVLGEEARELEEGLILLQDVMASTDAISREISSLNTALVVSER